MPKTFEDYKKRFLELGVLDEFLDELAQLAADHPDFMEQETEIDKRLKKRNLSL